MIVRQDNSLSIVPAALADECSNEESNDEQIVQDSFHIQGVDEEAHLESSSVIPFPSAKSLGREEDKKTSKVHVRSRNVGPVRVKNI